MSTKIGTIAHGSHAPGAIMCAMEWAAKLAGEPHSDSPSCVSPVIRGFMISWNDGIIDDARRTELLRPMIQLTLATRTNARDEKRRGMLALDWYIRTCVPAWLDLCPATRAEADALRALPEIVDVASAKRAAPLALAAREKSAVAWAAAVDAAWDAAVDALRSTTETLQVSAQDLVRRMCAVGRANAEEGKP